MNINNNVLTLGKKEFTTLRDFILDLELDLPDSQEESLKSTILSYVQALPLEPKPFAYMEQFNILTWNDLALVPKEELNNCVEGLIIVHNQFKNMFILAKECGVLETPIQMIDSLEFPGMIYQHDQSAHSSLILQDPDSNASVELKTTL